MLVQMIGLWTWVSVGRNLISKEANRIWLGDPLTFCFYPVSSGHIRSSKSSAM